MDVDIDKRISCARCEACCCRLMVVLQPEDRVPPWLVDERHGLEVMRQLDDGWCAALDRGTFRCGIYEQRPQACRDFATGSRECRTERRENGIVDPADAA